MVRAESETVKGRRDKALMPMPYEQVCDLEEDTFVSRGNPVPMSLFRGCVFFADPDTAPESMVHVYAPLLQAYGAARAAVLDDPEVTHVLYDPADAARVHHFVEANQARVAAGLRVVHLVPYAWVADSLAQNLRLPEHPYQLR